MKKVGEHVHEDGCKASQGADKDTERNANIWPKWSALQHDLD